MNIRRSFVKALAVAAVSCLLNPIAVMADGNVPMPTIPQGQGESCVEDTDFMRRNHMSLLDHQRDETMRKGVRSEKHSLKECIACHAVAGDDAIPVTVSSPRHFCRSCHDYAAVSIDCFQCHASRPETRMPHAAGSK